MPHLIFLRRSLQQEFKAVDSPFAHPLTALLAADRRGSLGPRQRSAEQLLPGKQEAVLVMVQS